MRPDSKLIAQRGALHTGGLIQVDGEKYTCTKPIYSTQYRIASINGEGLCISDGSLANNSFGQAGEVVSIFMTQAGISIRGATAGELLIFSRAPTR